MSAPTTTPRIVGPPWCTVSVEEHAAELGDWEGHCIHRSTEITRDGLDGGMTVELIDWAWFDGTPDADTLGNVGPVVEVGRVYGAGLVVSASYTGASSNSR